MKVATNSPLFYKWLTEKEIEFRQRSHPLELSDVATLGSHFGEFEISQDELNRLVNQTPRVECSWGSHHRVWIGGWELGLTWDSKLVEANKL